ncbi:GltJ1 [Desulforapulum autotrophicum HRM2]|uniref:GltJ1 n=1 Tax=Desulforapulum autotrophicum (strain ATCC 43914 / DSM 3382 / VKM B-1955 / HRM2) TaxID=177437 RepID=C0QJV4_DESAH|nr:amino acid ABC transporter permease [Desulforapulum autotrophicum]ACN13957.1 GltJ1 [Desulforapulum autotrophicum HRM2]
MLVYDFKWSILWEEPYGGWLLSGVATTVKLGIICCFLSLLMGIIIGTFRITRNRPLRIFAEAYTEFFRDIPLLVQLFFWYFAMPTLLPEQTRIWMYQEIPNFEFWIVVVGLSLYSSSRMAEQIRAGINSISPDQLNAALSSGFSHYQAYRYIILPLAVRLVIPPLTTEALTVFKNTALAMTVGVLETTFMSQQVEAYTFHGLEATTAACIIYMIITLVVVGIMGLLEKKLAIPGLIIRKGAC